MTPPDPPRPKAGRSWVLFVTARPGLATRYLRRFDSAEVFTEALAPCEVTDLTTYAFPDVIVIDMNVPGGGIDLVQAIRKVSADPWIVMLGWDNEVDIVVALEVGADDYAVLPCRPAEMHARITAALRRLAIQRGQHHA